MPVSCWEGIPAARTAPVTGSAAGPGTTTGHRRERRKMTAQSPQRQQLQQLLDPVVSSAGYELVDLSVSSAGRRSLLRVTVDGEDGIDLDGVAVVSRAISTAMDSDDGAFTGPYVLEVSSPGVDRPLTEP